MLLQSYEKSFSIFYKQIVLHKEYRKLITLYIQQHHQKMFQPRYKLRPWIDPKRLDKAYLSQNPNAIDYLKENPHLIDWRYIYGNPNAFDIFEPAFKNPSYPTFPLDHHSRYIVEQQPALYVNWEHFSLNPSPCAVPLFKKYRDKLNWFSLSQNHGAIEMLIEPNAPLKWFSLSQNHGAIEMLIEPNAPLNWIRLSSNSAAFALLNANQPKLEWHVLSGNPCAVPILRQRPEKINFHILSSNPSDEAIQLLKENPDKINWINLSSNPAPAAIELLEQNPDKIYQRGLMSNPAAMHLLERIIDDIALDASCYMCLSKNPSIFVYDYEKMRTQMWKSDFFRELQEGYCHYDRVGRYSKEYRYDVFDDVYFESNEDV